MNNLSWSYSPAPLTLFGTAPHTAADHVAFVAALPAWCERVRWLDRLWRHHFTTACWNVAALATRAVQSFRLDDAFWMTAIDAFHNAFSSVGAEPNGWTPFQ